MQLHLLLRHCTFLQIPKLGQLHPLDFTELALVRLNHPEDLLFGTQVLTRLLPVELLEFLLQTGVNQRLHVLELVQGV